VGWVAVLAENLGFG
jgi:hypothetical protein